MATIIDLNSSIATRDFDGKSSERMWFLTVEFSDNLVEVVTEDGLGADHVCTIKLENFFTGSSYRLNAEFSTVIHDTGTVRAERRARMFIEKIQSRGTVDLSNWTKIH